MTREKFNNIVEDQIEMARNTLLRKQEEYSTEENPLHAFSVAANLQGISMREALGGMMIKHTTSIYDFIRSKNDISLEEWEEKIGDHINYLLLLKAILVEEED